MKRLAALVTMFLSVGAIIASPAGATSWSAIEPEQVIDRADVIALGSYELPWPGTQLRSNSLWMPVKFRVEHYYRGSGKPTLATAIDGMDSGIVAEAQEGGDKYLIFLERNKEEEDLLTPVHGPNGMINIKRDGTVRHNSAKNAAEYEEFLETARAATKPPDKTTAKPSVKDASTDEASKTQPMGLSGAAVILLIAGGAAFVIWRRQRR